jgi:hypothetical protein
MSILSRSLSWAPAPARRLAAVSLLAAAGLLLSTAALLSLGAREARAAAPETPATTFAVSSSSAGVLADGVGAAEFTPVQISEDGRYVAFQSASQNLGEAGPVGANEGFVKDLATDEVELVSRADGPGGEPAAAPGITTLELSGDGRFVVFTSAATNLGTALPGEEAGETHVYRRDLETGETTLVDRVSGAGGQILARGAEGNSISADGSVVAFTDRVANLEDPVGDHAETAEAVGYVRDLEADTTTAVSRADGAAGELGEEAAEGLSLSPDGRFVTFYTRSGNLDPAFAPGTYQLYLRDIATDTTSLLSQNANGEAGDSNSFGGSFSGGSGCFLDLESSAANLLEPTASGVPGGQTYVIDRCAEPPTISLVSLREGGALAAFSYSGFESPAVTADGGEALFAAEFPSSGCCHLYLRDLGAGTTTTLDRAGGAAGALADEEVQYFAIAANGCRVAFSTAATNLGAGTPPDPGDEPTEVYVRQLAPCSGEGDGSGGGGGGAGEAPGSGDGAGAGSSGSNGACPGPGASSNTAPACSGGSGNGRTATVTSLKIGRAGIAVVVSDPGTFRVRIRRLVGAPRHHWQLVRTGSFAAIAAGSTSFAWPPLGPGRYRLNIHLAGMPEGESTVRILTVR